MMFPHPRALLLFFFVSSALCVTRPGITGSSQISELKSKISGVEELLEEFRKQLQEEDRERERGSYNSRMEEEEEEEKDACLEGFEAAESRIIRATASIERGAAFLSAPGGVYGWRECVHACCAEPHCTVAVMEKEMDAAKQRETGLRCYLFNCTYRETNVCAFSFQPGFSTYSRATAVRNATGTETGTVTRTVMGTGTGTRREHHGPVADPAARQGQIYHGRGEGILGDENGDGDGDAPLQDLDEPPRSEAGLDVVVQLPTDWAILDGRDSVDDHGITHFEWALVKGDPSVNMKVTHPGLLKLTGLREGVYTFQMTITDTVGQNSSDKVSVTVLAPEHHAEVCTHHCSRYQFMCDDGCCIDISFACDGKQQCPDRSDEDFCQNFDGGRKAVTHTSSVPSHAGEAREAQGRAMIPVEPNNTPNPVQPKLQKQTTLNQGPCVVPPVVGPCKGAFSRWYYDADAGECKHFRYGGCKGNHNNFLQQADCVNECIQKSAPVTQQATVVPPQTTQANTATSNGTSETRLQNSASQSQNSALASQNSPPVTKGHMVLGGQLPPESGAILPLVLGVIISILLLVMVGCRMRVVRHKMKKARPLTTEESDYLINGMYL